MDTVKTQITDFLKKCEEIKNCKFIMATTKIKDLLKSIVNSAELYELFTTVATNFDYMAAKQRCFVEYDDGRFGGSCIVLPETVGDRLAFIFCLLVEFDHDNINFNAFLQKYYPKDGSYYASYHRFCDEVIGSLEAIICDIFAGELAHDTPEELPAEPLQIPQSGEDKGAIKLRMPEREETPKIEQTDNKPDTKVASSINLICLLLESEKDGVEMSELSEEDKDGAKLILDGLERAVRDCNAELVKALTCGYNYFVLNTEFVSEGLEELFNALGEYVTLI